MTSTLTAKFVDAREYLDTYCDGMWSAPKYIDYLNDVHPWAQGVVIMFGSAVVDHWLKLDVYFTSEEDSQAKQDYLDELVAQRLQKVLSPGFAAVPILEFLRL